MGPCAHHVLGSDTKYLVGARKAEASRPYRKKGEPSRLMDMQVCHTVWRRVDHKVIQGTEVLWYSSVCCVPVIEADCSGGHRHSENTILLHFDVFL